MSEQVSRILPDSSPHTPRTPSDPDRDQTEDGQSESGVKSKQPSDTPKGRRGLGLGFGTALLVAVPVHAKVFFDTPVFEIAGVPSAVAVGDVDGDGDPDAVVVTAADGLVRTQLNTGGVLAPGQTLPVGADPQDVALHDVNGDDDLDAIVACAGDGTVAVLLGAGDGTFGPATSYPTDAGAAAVAIAKIGPDVHSDLIVMNATAETVSVLTNAGDGTFGAAQNTFVGDEPSGIAAGDLDENGLADLAITRRAVDEDNNGSVLIMLDDGAGGLVVDRSYRVIGRPTACAIGDLTGDQIVDVAVASFKFGVLLNRGQADFGDGFVESNLFYDASAQDDVALADIDGDDDLDVALLHFDYMSVMENLGGFRMEPSPIEIALDQPVMDGGQSPSVDWAGIAAADFNGDDAIDLVAAGNVDADGHLVLPMNRGAGFPQPLAYGISTTVNIAGAADVAFGDIDGDDVIDIITANDETNDVTYLINEGDGTFGDPFILGYPGPQPTIPPSVPVGGIRPVAIAAGRLDAGVGGADVVTANHFSASISVLRNDDAARLQPGASYATGPLPSDVELGDLDGDQDLDAIVGHRAGSQISILANNGDATFADQVPIDAGSGPRDVAVAPLDDDADLDIAVVNALDETITILLNQGSLVFTVGSTLDIAAPHAITADDWDGNGSIDLAVLSESDGLVWIIPNLGKASFGTPVPYVVPVGADAIDSGDVNGSGKAEVIVANRDRTVSVLMRTGGTFTVVNHRTDIFETAAVGVADLDDDGLLEMVVADALVNRVGVLEPLPGIEPEPCPADINGSGQIGFDDLQIVLQSWGSCDGDCPADINDSGNVGFDDLQIVLQAWGSCGG